MQQVRARLVRLPVWLVDGGIALVVVAGDVSSVWLFRDMPSVSGWRFHGPGSVAVGAVLAAELPLLLRRRYPQTVLGAVVVGTLLERGMRLPTTDLAVYVALFTVSDYCPHRRALAGLGLATGPLVAIVWYTHPQFVVLDVIYYLAAWALGDRQHKLRALVAQREREREDKARLAAASERTRIARDLHDVVAHSVSVMVLHAAAARRTLSKDPSRAEEAMAQVEATGRRSLTELRRLLGVLREGQHTELSPAPQLAYLDDLIDQFRAAGLPVQVKIIGESGSLANQASADMSAYRIIQEALTNALKHAHPSAVVLTLRYTARELQIEVLDDGRSAATEGWQGRDGVGHGLVGMRERAALVGGRLEVGPRPTGGFRVAATLPLGPDGEWGC